MIETKNDRKERPDWCVSRQRFWRARHRFFNCDACGTRLEDLRGAAQMGRECSKRRPRTSVVPQHTPPREALLLARRNDRAPAGGAQMAQENDILGRGGGDSGSSNLSRAEGLGWPRMFCLFFEAPITIIVAGSTARCLLRTGTPRTAVP